MYKLLIVDDEEIEREGMAQFIDWEVFGVTLLGTACNGMEALEKMEEEQPDIVMTDIKMPVMDGIELICRARELYPKIQFIVLSGYGEYEFTSRVMEYGVRHYLLKPCDEEQIEVVLDKVKQEIEKGKERHIIEKAYQDSMSRLLPKAKKQIFRDLLLDAENLEKTTELVQNYIGRSEFETALLGMRTMKGFDYLEQFIMGNILLELLDEENVYLSTTIGTAIYYLVDSKVVDRLEPAVERALAEFRKVKQDTVYCAVSEIGELTDMPHLYEEVQELLKIGQMEGRKGLITYTMFRAGWENTEGMADYERLKEAEDFADVLFEIYLAFMKMEYAGYTFAQKEEVMSWIIKVFCGELILPDYEEEGQKEKEWQLLEHTVCAVMKEKEKEKPGEENRDTKRAREILFHIFRCIQNQELNIRYLTKQVLFMNEDYFGRIFVKSQKQKFSDFLLERRIALAKRMIEYDPGLKIAHVAEMVGYSPDGQYFSKAFRKVEKMTPVEYRDQIISGK